MTNNLHLSITFATIILISGLGFFLHPIISLFVYIIGSMYLIVIIANKFNELTLLMEDLEERQEIIEKKLTNDMIKQV